MSTHTAEADIFDALHHFKDYPAEVDKLDGLIKARSPHAQSLLDVACGTGSHLQLLQGRYSVEGLDLSASLIDIARAKCPEVPFHLGDMIDFSLPRRFDVVTCLFSAIAYMVTPERVGLAIARMRDHLNPGGLVMVEPWFARENYWEGTVSANFVNEPELKISWILLNDREGDVSVLDSYFTVGTPQGIRQFREQYRVGLMSTEQYLEQFEKAGLETEHDSAGLCGRGMFIGRLPDRAES